MVPVEEKALIQDFSVVWLILREHRVHEVPRRLESSEAFKFFGLSAREHDQRLQQVRGYCFIITTHDLLDVVVTRNFYRVPVFNRCEPLINKLFAIHGVVELLASGRQHPRSVVEKLRAGRNRHQKLSSILIGLEVQLDWCDIFIDLSHLGCGRKRELDLGPPFTDPAVRDTFKLPRHLPKPFPTDAREKHMAGEVDLGGILRVHKASTVHGGLVPLQVKAQQRVIVKESISNQLHLLLLQQVMAHIDVHECLVDKEGLGPLLGALQVEWHLV